MAKTMILQSIFLAYVATISIILMSKGFILVEADSPTGFTIDLIHRDSPQSPSYNPSLLPSQRLTKALRRSFNRIRRFRTKCHKRTPVTDIVSVESGEFLMKYFVGTPPILSFGIADTGSDLTWTQCSPCLKCFKQKSPLFNSSKSSTYRRVSCKSTSCNAVSQGLCSKSRHNCLYSELYGDGSVTKGELATDTIRLGSTRGQRVSFPKLTFGCGFKNYGIFSSEESGIVGLGGGEFSLISQLYPSIQGKFSYCLVPLSSKTSNTSKMNFGSNAVVSGKGVVSTPLVSKEPKTFYFLTLLGVSIGHQRLEFYDTLSNDSKTFQEGNIIIDSGTTLTFLPYKFYTKIEELVRSVIKLRRIKDPQNVLDLCYYTKKDIHFSDIIFHFKGADVVLKPENSFVRTSNVAMCLAFQPSVDLAIYGNLAQVNFLIGYDLGKKTLSFKHTDCGRS